jgi:hypothetical protein
VGYTLINVEKNVDITSKMLKKMFATFLKKCCWKNTDNSSNNINKK